MQSTSRLTVICNGLIESTTRSPAYYSRPVQSTTAATICGLQYAVVHPRVYIDRWMGAHPMAGIDLGGEGAHEVAPPSLYIRMVASFLSSFNHPFWSWMMGPNMPSILGPMFKWSQRGVRIFVRGQILAILYLNFCNMHVFNRLCFIKTLSLRGEEMHIVFLNTMVDKDWQMGDDEPEGSNKVSKRPSKRPRTSNMASGTSLGNQCKRDPPMGWKRSF